MSQEAVVLSTIGNGNVEGNNAEDRLGPIMLNGVYNPVAHHYNEERRVGRDLNIPKIVEELGQETCNFIIVERLVGEKYSFTYHPNPDGVLGENLEWISCKAISKGNAGRFYNQVANGRIEWHYMILRGDILRLITNTFGVDIVNNLHVNDLKLFSKNVAKFIMDYPHEENGTYGCYILMFLNIIRLTDERISPTTLRKVAVAIAVCLKNVLDYNDKDLPEMEIYRKVRDISVKPTIQKCSKNVEYKISKIDQNAKKASLQLDELDRLAEEEIESEKKQMNMKMQRMQELLNAKFNNTKLPALTAPVAPAAAAPVAAAAPAPAPITQRKRKIEEVDGEKDKDEDEKQLNKVQKVESPQDYASPNVTLGDDLLGLDDDQ